MIKNDVAACGFLWFTVLVCGAFSEHPVLCGLGMNLYPQTNSITVCGGVDGHVLDELCPLNTCDLTWKHGPYRCVCWGEAIKANPNLNDWSPHGKPRQTHTGKGSGVGRSRSCSNTTVGWQPSVRATRRGREVRTDFTQNLNCNMLMSSNLDFGLPAPKVQILFSVCLSHPAWPSAT